jgi:hypothetical protein
MRQARLEEAEHEPTHQILPEVLLVLLYMWRRRSACSASSSRADAHAPPPPAELTHQILPEVLLVRLDMCVRILLYTTDTRVRRTRFYVCVRKLRTTFCSGRTTFCRGRTTFCRGVRGHAGKRAGRRR